MALSILTLLVSCEKENAIYPQLTETEIVAVNPSLSATHALSGSTSMDTMDSKNFIITVNNTGGPTTDRCTIFIQKFLPLGAVHFSEFLSSMEGLTVDNPNWRLTDQPTRYMLVSEPGYVIPESSNSLIGVTLMSFNMFGGFSITTTIKASTGGGETPNTDNISVTHFKIE